MPQFGLAHRLLSGRHPDTSPPAGGADPNDGDVPTWSSALGAWLAQAPVPVQGADHSQLVNLDADDHPHYALLAGRSGGQSLIGGLAASENLTLQSTAHATRGYVRAQDDLQLLSDIIRDSGGNARLTLDTSSPHLLTAGDVQIPGYVALGNGASPYIGRLVNITGTLDTQGANALNATVYGNRSAASQITYGLLGGAFQQGTPSYSLLYGLYFLAQQQSSSPCLQMAGQLVAVASTAAGSGAITQAFGYYLATAGWGGSKPATVAAYYALDQGGVGVGLAYGLDIVDQTATTVRLLELGPTVPYLRLLGGANPPANQTNLYLKEQATLRQVQWKDGAAIGGGDRVMVLV